MPLYEYTCDSCDNHFELLIRTRDERAACPECGAKKVTKQLSVPAAHSASRDSLPVCEVPRGGGCGLPQCGTGGCRGLGF